jgi:lipid-A-disaccharide synthase
VRTIGQAVDLVLCLLPFEAAFYAEHAVQAQFVGHPLADQIPLEPDRAAARVALGLPGDAQVVAVLPGSRVSEVTRLGPVFAATAARLAAQRAPRPPAFIAPMASPTVRELFSAQVAAASAPVRLLDGQSRLALAAADAVLVASGTATLETLLSKRPMVVAYRVAPLTAFLARELGMVKVPYCSQPNLLAGEGLVPEFLQEAATPQALSAALAHQLDDGANRERLEARFREMHLTLRCGGSERAAEAVLGLLQGQAGG